EGNVLRLEACSKEVRSDVPRFRSEQERSGRRGPATFPPTSTSTVKSLSAVAGSITLKHGEANHESCGSLRDAVRQSPESGEIIRIGVWLANADARRGDGQLRAGDNHGNGPDGPQEAWCDQWRVLREKA